MNLRIAFAAMLFISQAAVCLGQDSAAPFGQSFSQYPGLEITRGENGFSVRGKGFLASASKYQIDASKQELVLEGTQDRPARYHPIRQDGRIKKVESTTIVINLKTESIVLR